MILRNRSRYVQCKNDQVRVIAYLRQSRSCRTYYQRPLNSNRDDYRDGSYNEQTFFDPTNNPDEYGSDRNDGMDDIDGDEFPTDDDDVLDDTDLSDDNVDNGDGELPGGEEDGENLGWFKGGREKGQVPITTSTPFWDKYPTNQGKSPTNHGSPPTNQGSTPTNQGTPPTYQRTSPTNQGRSPIYRGRHTQLHHCQDTRGFSVDDILLKEFTIRCSGWHYIIISLFIYILIMVITK